MSNFHVFRSTVAGSRPDALPCPTRSFNHRCSSTARAARLQPLPLAAAASEVPTVSAAISKPCKQQMAEDRLPQIARPPLFGANNSGLNCAYSSSGSNHGPSSICLADMVNDFFENEGDRVQRFGTCGRSRCNCFDEACGETSLGNFIGNEGGDNLAVQEDDLSEILQGVISGTDSTTELSLLVDVAKAMKEEETELSVLGVLTPTTSNGFSAAGECASVYLSSLIRPVMKRLQQAGYNAAICKSRWNHGDGVPAGDYDYIDVILEGLDGKQDRIIVDIDFKEQFEIARGSDSYSKLLNVLPCVFVGKGEKLQKILKIMSNATKRSLKQQGLHHPPWRKQRYMQAKWFSSYRRTTNPQESSRKRELLAVDEGFRNGITGPRFSTEFTKVMDMAFFRAQAKAVQQSHRMMEKRQKDLGLLNAEVGDEVPHMSKQSGGKRVILSENQRNAAATQQQYPQRRKEQVRTAMCSDWQLPALSEKSCVNRRRDRVSGLAAVWKQEALARAAAAAS